MRVRALLLAIVLCVGAMPRGGAAAAPSREDALVTLCRVWNAVRFMHPFVHDETDARWDDALLANEGIVERDPSRVREAAAAMLATLHDPLTTVDALAQPGALAMPRVEDAGGIRVVTIGGYADEARAKDEAAALAAAFVVPPAVHGMIVDLRPATPPSLAQIASLEDAWDDATIAPRVIDEPLALSLLAQRFLLGFADESGAASDSDYHEGRETLGRTEVVAPAASAHAVPVAFVTGAHAVLPGMAVALTHAGRARIFSEDGSPGIVPGGVVSMDAGNGVHAFLRTSAPLERVDVAAGGVDAAKAWLKTTASPAAAAQRVPVDVPVPIAKRYAGAALPDEAHRVLAAFRMWGTIAYAFPYAALMRDDWDAALRNGLSDLHAAATPLAYQLALAKMYAHIHDTHGSLNAPAITMAYAAAPPFVVRDVQGRPTIVRVVATVAQRDGFKVGDVVEAVDGENVDARIARLRPYLAASTEQSMREMLLAGVARVSVFGGAPGSTMALRLRDASGRTRDVRVARAGPVGALYRRTRAVIDVLPGNIGYVDLARLMPTEVAAAFTRLAGVRAFIFDLRGYPHGTAWAIAPRFAASATRVALFKTPVRRSAVGVLGTQGESFVPETRDFYQIIDAQAPRITKPLIVVIDARAVSQSEHSALIFREMAHARFVGERSMGANGDVTSFVLPGGVTANFSGQAVLHADGAQLQRVGIVPDVTAHQSLAGVRAGDDELLYAGLREALHVSGADGATSARALVDERRLERADSLAQRRLPPPPPPVAADAARFPSEVAAGGANYSGGHDPAVTHRDGATIVLRATSDAPEGFGTVTARIPVEPYHGKRVRVSGFLRTAGARSAGFWLRVDGPPGVEAFDNMADRAISGTQEWTPFSIVLDVPADATNIVGGLLLQGGGIVWADDVRIDTVGPSVPVTGAR